MKTLSLISVFICFNLIAYSSQTIDQILLNANQGNVEAQSKLGSYYDHGYKVDVDKIKSAKWYHKAAEQGHIRSQVVLARKYERGDGIPQDGAMAVKWYREAANKNDILAMRSLHSLHEYGSTSGVDVDKVESAKWCLKAAELGVPSLQHIMAIKYQSGEGVPIDTKAAIFWCRESAERGYSNAQYDLAQKYYKGEGVPQDFVLAYKWFNIATGDTDSPLLSTCKHYRDLVSKDMTKEQIAEGQKMSRDWNKKGSW